MVHPTGDTLEEVTLCSKCKHSIILKCPRTTSEELCSLSRRNTALSYTAPLYLTDEHKNDLDNEIIKLEETLARLRSRREDYRAEEYFRRSLLAPIRTLPVEILREVFIHCCGMGASMTDSRLRPNQFEPGGYLQALALSHVSHYWRSVALSISILWSNISLRFSVNNFPINKLLELYLSRSGSAPLDICLSIFFSDMPFDRENYYGTSRRLFLLERHTSRWRSLTVDYAILDFFKNRFSVPSLVELALTDEEYYSLTNDLGPIENFQDCASLRRVLFTHSPEAFKMPWSQITELDLPSGWLTDLQEVAGIRQNVTSITFLGIAWVEDDFTGLTLPSLESLNFKDTPLRRNDFDQLDGIFSLVVCPRLLHLSVQSATTYDKKWPLESFKMFLSSAPLLSVLVFEGLLLGPHLFVECFPYLPNLTRLSIFKCTETIEDESKESSREEAVNEKFFRSLVFGNTDRMDPDGPASREFLPSLQVLHVRGKRLDLNSIFVDFVSSRRVASISRAVAELMEVKLDFKDTVFTFSDENQLRLKVLCRDGMKIFDCGYMLDGDKRPFSPPRVGMIRSSITRPI